MLIKIFNKIKKEQKYGKKIAGIYKSGNKIAEICKLSWQKLASVSEINSTVRM